ncbi:Target of rapamycin complex 2 subunit AVO2 [Madurella mycetomatis]|uniref:Target of rapamycin complex 2 subunit AVO2 n=1 Tax=Madurella mycetomatis TaxID=100816 RepID=A0A175W3F6_9PEZI|nr:Target of rapamycin complex 2 subunit AVO2 [Madurella mycetomatis]
MAQQMSPDPDRLGIDPSIRLRRAIHSNDALLTRRILKSHPHLLHNPDHSVTGNANSNLHLAASLGHLSICKLLVELGHEAGTPALNDDHQTALLLAAAGGHTEVVHFLSEHDPSSILRQDVRGRNAIMEASLHGHDTVVQILLTYAPGGAAAALSQADLDGNTALHFASSNGNLLVLRTLLAAGADAGRKNVWNWTAEAYSATVQAEVYLKALVAEVERRKMAQAQAQTQAQVRRVDEGQKKVVSGEGTKKGGAVRLVGKDVGD